MNETDIIGEIRATREAFAAAHGFDIGAMLETLRRHQAEGGRPVVSFGPRPVVRVEPAAKPPVEHSGSPAAGPLPS